MVSDDDRNVSSEAVPSIKTNLPPLLPSEKDSPQGNSTNMSDDSFKDAGTTSQVLSWDPDEGEVDSDPMLAFGFPGDRKGDSQAAEQARLREQVQQLYRKISQLTTEKTIAEEKAERAVERVEELKQLLDTDMSDIQKDAQSISKDTDRLKVENKMLKERLRDTESHIFSLQPYRKELTPEEVGRVSSKVSLTWFAES